MKLKVLLALAVITGFNVKAQQNSLFNTYSYDLMQLNIATVGRTCLEANLNYRAQWVGVSDSPRLYQLNAGMALGNSNGVGLKLYQQSVGLLKVTNITGAYSYRMKVSKEAKLHFGIGASYNQNRFEVGKVSAADKNDVTLTNAQNNIRSNNFDCETGVLLLGKKLTAGVAIEHLYNTNTEFSSNSLNFKPNINVIAAYKIKASETFEVEPWLVAKYTVSGKFQPEVLVKGKYAEKFSAGLGYRVNYGYLFLMGAELGKIKVAYSFDYGSRTGKAGFGTSHQILLGFDLCRQSSKLPKDGSADNSGGGGISTPTANEPNTTKPDSSNTPSPAILQPTTISIVPSETNNGTAIPTDTETKKEADKEPLKQDVINPNTNSTNELERNEVKPSTNTSPDNRTSQSNNNATNKVVTPSYNKEIFTFSAKSFSISETTEDMFRSLAQKTKEEGTVVKVVRFKDEPKTRSNINYGLHEYRTDVVIQSLIRYGVKPDKIKLVLAPYSEKYKENEVTVRY